MIRHVSNRKIKSWKKIKEALEDLKFYHYGSIRSIVRFFKKIRIPIRREGKNVYIEQDVICSIKAFYVFGRDDIAKFIGRSKVQLFRYMKHSRGLKFIIRKSLKKSDGNFIYARKSDLNRWAGIPLNDDRLYDRFDKRINMSSYLYSRLYDKNLRCPVCNRPCIEVIDDGQILW